MNFYFSYHGNKRKEFKHIAHMIDFNEYDCYAEPFGGSCAISRELYRLTDSPCIVSDIDDDLTHFCNNFHKNSIKIIKSAMDICNELKEDKDKYKEFVANPPKKHKRKWLVYYLVIRSFYAIRPGFYPTNRNAPTYATLLKNVDTINSFFENNHYNHKPFNEAILEYKDNARCLVFLDPPYLTSSQSLYRENCVSQWADIYQFMRTCDCKFILIVDDNFFMRMVFEQWFKFEYGKQYENNRGNVSRRSVIHCVYSNI